MSQDYKYSSLLNRSNSADANSIRESGRAQQAEINEKRAKLREEEAKSREVAARESARSSRESAKDFSLAARVLAVRWRNSEKEKEVITQRSKDLLFHLAMTNEKFRLTIKNLKKYLPEHVEVVDGVALAVDEMMEKDTQEAADRRMALQHVANVLNDQMDEEYGVKEVVKDMKEDIWTAKKKKEKRLATPS